MPLPPTFTEQSVHPHLKQRKTGKALKTVEGPGLTEEDMRRIVVAYFGQVSFCDHLIGRLTTTLLKTKQLDNTLISFTANHGKMLDRHGLMFKGVAMLEDLVRIPLLVVPTGGLDTARVSAFLISHINLIPTVLDWCGAEIPTGLEDISIRPQVEQIAAPNRTAVVCEYHSANWTNAITPLRM